MGGARGGAAEALYKPEGRGFDTILQILAHLVHYRLQIHWCLSLRDYMDFLKRSRRKVYQQARTRPKQGRYLDVLDSPYHL